MGTLKAFICFNFFFFFQLFPLFPQAMKHVKAEDAKLEGEPCGSFRRGASSSGDLDLLLTHPDFYATESPSARGQVSCYFPNCNGGLTPFPLRLSSEIAQIRQSPHQICHHAAENCQPDEGCRLCYRRAQLRRDQSNLRGVAEQMRALTSLSLSVYGRLPHARTRRQISPHRHSPLAEESSEGERARRSRGVNASDTSPRFSVYLSRSSPQYPLALLYFTGSDEFAKTIRRKAIDKGFRLNEYHLW